MTPAADIITIALDAWIFLHAWILLAGLLRVLRTSPYDRAIIRFMREARRELCYRYVSRMERSLYGFDFQHTLDLTVSCRTSGRCVCDDWGGEGIVPDGKPVLPPSVNTYQRDDWLAAYRLPEYARPGG